MFKEAFHNSLRALKPKEGAKWGLTDKLLLLANFSCGEPSPKRQSTKLPPATGSWKENLPLHASCGGLGPWFFHRARPQLPCDFSPIAVMQESEGGLYICMNTFLGFGKQYVERHFNKTGQRVYLHLRRTRRPVGKHHFGHLPLEPSLIGSISSPLGCLASMSFRFGTSSLQGGGVMMWL